MDVIGLIGLIVAIAALIVGIIAAGVPFIVEKLKKPSIEIVPSQWQNPAFLPWTFAVVRVRNKPHGRLFGIFLERQTAHACKADIKYYRENSTSPFIEIRGRWSNSTEPLSFVPSSLTTIPSSPIPSGTPFSGIPVTGAPYIPVDAPVSGGTAPSILASSITPAVPKAFLPRVFSARNKPEFKQVYDPNRDPKSHDVATDGDGEEVAVAILRNQEIFAFSTESYNHSAWGKPDWQLDLRQTYRIVVRVHGPSVDLTREFKLECLTTNPSTFRIQVHG